MHTHTLCMYYALFNSTQLNSTQHRASSLDKLKTLSELDGNSFETLLFDLLASLSITVVYRFLHFPFPLSKLYSLYYVNVQCCVLSVDHRCSKCSRISILSVMHTSCLFVYDLYIVHVCCTCMYVCVCVCVCYVYFCLF